MIKKKTALLLTTATLLGGGSAAAFATAGSVAQNAFSGDAEVQGNRVSLDAETPRSVDRVTFLYGGKALKGRLTDDDVEDGTKEWDAFGRAVKSDRRAGATITFRVKACDGGACKTSRFRDIVELDD